MNKSPNYRHNQSGSSLFENAQTLETLSKQRNPLGFISKMIDFEARWTNFSIIFWRGVIRKKESQPH